MASGFFTLLQLFWPFLKEAIFGHGPFKAWLRRNYVTLLWFGLIFSMLIIVLGLSSLVRTLESDLRKSHAEADQFKKEQIAKDATYKQDYEKLQQKVESLQHELAAKTCPEPKGSGHPRKPAPHPVDHSDENNSILQRLRHH